MHKFVYSLAAVLALLAPAAQGQGGGVGKDARVPSIDVKGRALADVVQNLRELSGANIVLLPAEYEPVTLQLTDVHWRDALELAAQSAGAVVSERTSGILVVDRPPPVTYEANKAEITEVIQLIAKMAGANIVVAPEVTGTISVRLNDVPWRDALDVTVKTLGYVVIEEGRGILRVVDPVTLQAQMVTRSYQMRYLRPRSRFKPQIKSEFLQAASQATGAARTQDVVQNFPALMAMKKALSPGGDIDYIEHQNVFIVRDTVEVHESIREMLARLDIEPAQVFVDVKFVSTENGDLLDLGVDYGDEGPRVSINGGQIPITLPFNLGSGGWEDSIIANPSSQGPWADPALNAGNTVIPDTIFGALNFTQVQATLRLLQQDTKSDVIQAPKVIAVDGTEATIFVGETIRYAEARSEQGQAGGLQLSLEEAESSPVDVGFQLLIVPHVIPGTNTLSMDVIPKETSLSGTGTSTLAPQGFEVFTVGASGLEGSIALPRTRSSTIVTTMLLESGQTAMIGGLTTEADVKIVTRIPFISRIPIIGELFKHRTHDRQRRSLMVFITPTLVHSSAENERLLQQELQRRKIRLKEQIEALVDPTYGQEPAEGAPVELTPVTPAPLEPTPVEPTPAEPTPAESTPAGSGG